MDSKKRQLLLMIGTTTSLLLSGCLTKKLHENHSYQENISSVLTSSDSKKLVVITNKFHYIFEGSVVLIQTLKSSIHPKIVAIIDTFYVDNNDDTSGTITLLVKNEATDEELDIAKSIGYKKYGNTLEANINLRGKRYDSNGVMPSLESQKLNKPYNIFVSEEQSIGEKTAKTLLTPITMTVDGMLMYISAPLFAVGVSLMSPFILLQCGKNPNCQ
jgi:Na+/H+ antiporter NhaA